MNQAKINFVELIDFILDIYMCV